MIAQALPKIFEQLEDVKKDASELRNFTITFLSLLLYINLIIVNTDAEQILRIAPVNLPLLNVPLPIISFYGFVPWLLLLFHLYLLIQHYLFSQQLFLFKKTLYDVRVTEKIRSHVLKNLGHLPFLHWMIGEHHVLMQAVLTLITLVCLIIWPLLTLLWLQMAILPYHSETLICWQRATILLDVLLIGWLWTKTLTNTNSSATWWKLGGRGCYHLIVFALYLLWRRIATTFRTGEIDTSATLMANVKTSWHDAFNALALALGLFLALFLSLAVATLPDSWQELQLSAKANSKPLDIGTLPFWLQVVDFDESFNTLKPTRVAFWPTAWLHEQHAQIYHIADSMESEKFKTMLAKGAKRCQSLDKSLKDEKTTKNDLKLKAEEKAVQDSCLMVQPWLPRNLILREKVLTATIDPNLKPELEAKLHSGAANKTNTPASLSDTRSVSLSNPPTLADILAQVVGLNLQNRNFDYADFTELSLPKVDLRYASLKHAQLTNTRLEQARLEWTHFEGANLQNIDLTGAELQNANLTGAYMNGANLTGADMTHANLTGADMTHANLTGAEMSYAHLTGADMTGANLTGADMSFSNLTGANMSGVTLTGANMSYATLTGANMSYATLTGADMTFANLTGANMRHANLTGAKMSNVSLTGADMTDAYLTGTKMYKANLTGAILIGIVTDMYSEQALKKMTTYYQQQSEQELKNITTDYQQQLSLFTRYQTDQSSLATKINDFKHRVSQPADFSGVKKIKPCLRNDKNTEKALHDCTAIVQLNTQTQTNLVAVWRKLACDDETEKHWLAQAMVKRAQDYPWFAQALLDAAKDPNTCVGLANLTAENKVFLQKQVVVYESRKPTKP